jgi:hypothetical protein
MVLTPCAEALATVARKSRVARRKERVWVCMDA